MSLVFVSEETVEETNVTASVSVDSGSFPVEEDVVETSWCTDGVSASFPSQGTFPADELSDTSVDRSVVNTAGLTTWLPFKVDSSLTEVEMSGLTSVVNDLPVRGLVISSTYAEAVLVIELWTSEAVTCLVVLWVFTVFDNRSLVTVMAGLLMV